MSNEKEFKKFAIKSGYATGLQVHNYVSDIENMTRSVIEQRPAHFREVDVFARLIMDRIIFLGTQVDDNIANVIIAQLLFLQSVDAKKDILLYINSPGGSVYPGFGIYDTMQYIAPDVATICTGLAASMAAVLLAGGAKGKRSALPHARIMIHQPLGGSKGTTADMQITMQQMIEIKKDIYTILARHTDQKYESIENDSDRDYWMRASQAKDYGILDFVLERDKKK